MKTTKPEFLKWLRKQDPSREFNYVEGRTCLFASFLSEHCKLKGVSCGGADYALRQRYPLRTPFPTWMLRLGRRVCDELNCIFTISDVRKLLKN